MPRLSEGEDRSFLRLVRGASLSCQFVCCPSAYAYAPATDGGGIASRLIRFRIAANNARGTATSANWKATYFECCVTFAPILISFSRRVVSVQWLGPLSEWHDLVKEPCFHGAGANCVPCMTVSSGECGVGISKC